MELNRITYPNTKKYPIKIVQFGEGNFLRCFIDWMVQEMNEKADFDAGIAIVKPREKGIMINILNKQEGLYHVWLKGIVNGNLINKFQLVDSVQKSVNPYSNYQGFLSIAHEPELKFMFSNTTEAGIVYTEGDVLEEPQQNFPAKVTALLYERYQFFKKDKTKGLNIIPCELIENNGEELKNIIFKFIEYWNLPIEFKTWIEESCTFYNTLVDRIVPGYPREKIKEVHEKIGYEDQMVVEGEAFHFFVIQGTQKLEQEFPATKAGLNVLFVDHLDIYRNRKVRILNGLHISMVALGIMEGIKTVKEYMDNDALKAQIKQVAFNEVIPSSSLIEEMEGIEAYANAILERFENPFTNHYLESISLNSIAKFTTRVVPTIVGYYSRFGKAPEHISKALAALLYLYSPKNTVGFKPNDDKALITLIADAWAQYDIQELSIEKLAISLLSSEKLWHKNLAQYNDLVKKVVFHLGEIV